MPLKNKEINVQRQIRQIQTKRAGVTVNIVQNEYNRKK